MVWPVTLRKIAGHRYLQFPFLDAPVSEPELVSVFSYHVTEVRAASYVWHSWMWQLQNIPGVASKLKPGIRAFLIDDFEPVPVVLCKRAFFDLDRLFVRKAAEDHMRVKLESGLTLFGCLFETIKAYMKWGAQRVMETIAAERFMDLGSVVGDTILEVDEAVQCLERSDVEKIKQAQGELQRHSHASRVFREDFGRKARELREEAGIPEVFAVAVDLPETIPQAEARRFMPEGTSNARHSVWLSKAGSWNVHVPPNARVTATFARWGNSQTALRQVLRSAWQQWLGLKGLPKDACPWKGLLD